MAGTTVDRITDCAQYALECGYRKVPEFSDASKLCCNLPKIQTKWPNCSVLCQKDANGIAVFILGFFSLGPFGPCLRKKWGH